VHWSAANTTVFPHTSASVAPLHTPRTYIVFVFVVVVTVVFMVVVVVVVVDATHASHSTGHTDLTNATLQSVVRKLRPPHTAGSV
jgi:hypothetical protein